jgi:hypothetical protein
VGRAGDEEKFAVTLSFRLYSLLPVEKTDLIVIIEAINLQPLLRVLSFKA